MQDNNLLLDPRLRGTKCETCIEGTDLILGDFPKFPCVVCISRPDRNKDKSHYLEQVKSKDVSNAMCEIVRKKSYLNY